MSWLGIEGLEEFLPLTQAWSGDRGYVSPRDGEPEAFDALARVAEFGAHLDIHSVTPAEAAVTLASARARIWHFMDHLRKLVPAFPTRESLIIDYATLPDWQGMAFRGESGRTICAVASGFCDAIISAADGLFSCREFAPAWHGAYERTAEEIRINAEDWFSENRHIKKPGGYTFVGTPPPRSIHRKTAACIVAELAIEFAFLHEIGHVLAGHLPYAAGTRAKPRFHLDALSPYECPADPNPASTIETFLELDADCMALEMLIGFNFFRTTVLPLPDIPPLTAHEHRGRDFAHWSTSYSSGVLVVTALTLFYMLSCARTGSGRSWADTTHPTPRERLNCASLAIPQFAGQVASLDPAAIVEAFGPTSRTVLGAWKMFNLTGWQTLDGIHDVRSAEIEMTALLGSMNETYHRIMPSLLASGERRIGDAVHQASSQPGSNLPIRTVLRPAKPNWSWLGGEAIY